MLTVITPPGVEPITADEARLQTRAASTEDAYLALCIKGARASCESLTGRALITRTVEQTFDGFDSAGLILQSRPVASLTTVKYDDTAGVEQTLASCQLATVNDLVLVLPPIGTDWPDTRADKAGTVRVRFTTGYGATAASVPDDIRTWLLLTIGYLYAQRESFDMTGKVADIPNRFTDRLLDNFRVYGA